MMIVTTLDGREIKCAARWQKLEILARLTCELENRKLEWGTFGLLLKSGRKNRRKHHVLSFILF